MIERGISEQEVEEGIRKGAKRLQKPDRILSDHRYYCVEQRETVPDNMTLLSLIILFCERMGAFSGYIVSMI
jgi:hypothetical protein